MNPTPEQIKGQLQGALDALRLPYRVEAVKRGPSILRCFLQPVNDDDYDCLGKLLRADRAIAKKMGLSGIAISPIPGRAWPAVDIPLPEPDDVLLAELLNDKELCSPASPLCFPLGLNEVGDPVLCPLEKMPHLLIGGMPGSGKSMLLRTMLVSRTLNMLVEEELRLILCALEGNDMQPFQELPDLLCPVITSAEAMLSILPKLNNEILRRYSLFREAGANNLQQYNAAHETPLARLLVIIDEFAPLMKLNRTETEQQIARLAQFGRTAGVHLVLTTQHLTENVISGLIRANIPSRIAFRTANAKQARLLLDHSGAEKLLRPGDMLYKPHTSLDATRVQGCFIDAETASALMQGVRRIYDSITSNTPDKGDTHHGTES